MGDDSNESDREAEIAAENRSIERQTIVAERSFEGDSLAFCDSVPADGRDSGWFDDRLRDFYSSIHLSAGSTFRTTPRSFDWNPATIPKRHPLRAIAKVLEEAPAGSIVRMCLFADGPFGIGPHRVPRK